VVYEEGLFRLLFVKLEFSFAFFREVDREVKQ
jgi:hypothetical protein